MFCYVCMYFVFVFIVYLMVLKWEVFLRGCGYVFLFGMEVKFVDVEWMMLLYFLYIFRCFVISYYIFGWCSVVIKRRCLLKEGV